MTFDPDEFLQRTAPAAPAATPAFDPDDFLARTSTPAVQQPPQGGALASAGNIIGKAADFIGRTAVGAVTHPIQTAIGLGRGVVKSASNMATDLAANVNPEENEDINLTVPGRFPVKAAPVESSQDIMQRRETLEPKALTQLPENLPPQEERAAKIGEFIAPASAAEIALGKPVGVLVGKGLKALGKGVAGGAQAATKAEAKLDKSVEKTVDKALRPKTKTLADRAQFNTDMKESALTIARRRDNIKLEGAKGDEINKPTNIVQAAQATEQAESAVFAEYDALAKAAGDKGARFNSDDIIAKLDDLASPDGFYKGNKAAQEHANVIRENMKQLNGATPTQVQNRIKELNASLAPYYADATTKTKAKIEGSVATELRKALDDQISKLEGEGYQQLKNEYGHLAAIRKSVEKSATQKLNSRNGLGDDFMNVFNAGEVISGVINMNPAQVAKGAGGAAMRAYLKGLRDPDKYVKKMFDDAYKLADETQVAAPKAPVKVPEVTAKEPDLEVPAYLRKGRAPLPEQPLESRYNQTQFQETPLGAKAMEIAESSMKKKSAPPIEGIDYMSRDAAGDVTQQITSRGKMPILLPARGELVPDYLKREVAKSAKKYLKRRD
jgi:hypothetical protein